MQRVLPIIIFWLFALSSFAQEMQEGFTYLETGKYIEAKSFFENVLKTYPENRTARLCYGRAVGLSGDSVKAVTIFATLINEYPKDFEIKLNYAESLLWNNQFSEAESFYVKLVEEDKTSFPAVLGYANTLSNRKSYKKALTQVNKALQLKAGNPNALTSRKYIRLGYANELSQNKQYVEALILLDKNLLDYPGDKDTQLNKANIYLVTNDMGSAEKTYKALATNSKDSILSLNGLALVAHKNKKEKKALDLATTAKSKVEKYKDDKNLYLSTQERYIQALLWNRKFSSAIKELEQLKLEYPDEPRVLALSATEGMYTSKFKSSIQSYTNILSKSEGSFDGNLGIANAYRATGDDKKAFVYAFKTLDYYPKQPDAEKLIKTLKSSYTPFVELKTAFTFDNGNNEAVNLAFRSELPLSTKFKSELEYVHRRTKNTVFKNEASSNELALRFSYKFNGNLSLITKGGISKSNAFTNDYTQWTGEIRLTTKPFRLQNLDIGYQRQLQNFNADLIDREIVMNNYFLNYNLSTNINLGWYTQYIYTSQTDNNSRNLLFTSLYYNIFNRPAVKLGVNYQHMTFANQVPTIYFSPEKFNVVEVFADMISKDSGKWFYGLNGAAGYQFIEDDPGTTTYRAEGKLGYSFSDRLIGTLYGKYSNIASATATGFEFTEFGFLLKWYFLKQPIFNKKIMKLQKGKQNKR
ncbi:tetratricopeptide repeat protein [uncultured Aquimarina sp.]|uniref:tetratricopeptide repeat protein n=1 Tax=uncultured Aquimarina sp. TaxID=575652 RepID=UPI002638B862|nr:tetratricopeptide repeat protein [uncultured Aquimarina sp.]